MRLIATAFALIVCAAGFAQDHFPAIRGLGRPDSILRTATGVDAVRHLEDLGIVDPAEIYGSPKSRYAYAVFAHAAWAELKSILAYLEHGDKAGRNAYKAIEARAKELPRACIETGNLVYEFSSEITKLGGDTKAIRADSNPLRTRFEKAMADRYFAEHNPPPATPNWAIALGIKLKKEGWLVGYPDDYRNRPENPYVMAAATHAIMANITLATNDFEKKADAYAAGDPKAAELGPELSADVAALRKSASAEADLYKLIEETYYELIKLGADPQDMVSQIDDDFSRIAELRVPVFGESYRPFSDVAPTHWAAKAVDELKRAGVLQGYPDGRYRG